MKRIEQALPQFRDLPALIIWGMQDPVLPPSVLRLWQKVYPQAITHEIEDASHFLQEDAPERVVGYIDEFLKANS